MVVERAVGRREPQSGDGGGGSGDPVTGLVWAAALVLVGAGAAKLARPGPTARAAADSGIPGSSWLAGRAAVRLLGLAETAVGLTVLLAGGPRPAALLAVAFAALTAVAWRLMRERPDSDCGCFGRASAPVGRAHLIVDGVATAVGVVAVFRPAPGLAQAAVEDLGATVVLAGAAIVLSWLAYLAMTALPAVSRVRRRVEGLA